MTDWKQLGRDKAESVLNLIPKEWRLADIPSIEDQRDVTGSYIHQYLESKEIEITETDAVGIVQRTSTGIWTAVEVAKAFCHRAALAHQLLNCLHEIFFEAAIAEAEKLDQYYAQHKKPVGLLHGLPVSLKDQFHVRGVETHMGYIGWLGTFQGKKGTGKEKVFESELVRELRSLGATLYCKTSVPQTLMCGETVNNIVGYTRNPKNRHLTSGGSSGGESALIRARGSPVGFGTDIGGSVRIPAAFTGLYGLRPSVGRMPYEGAANSMDGQNSVLSVIGPLAATPDDLKLVFQAVLSTEPWFHDPLVAEIPWREEAAQVVSDPIKRLSRGLSFATFPNDGVCSVTPPVKRAIDTVVSAVEKLGHQVLAWQPPVSHDRLQEIANKCWYSDGGADCAVAFALTGEERAEQVFDVNEPQLDATTIMQLNIEKRDAMKEYMEYWNSTASLTSTGRPVDAIITPCAPFPAARPAKYIHYGYSIWVNVLDYTSVVIPVTTADKSVDKKVENFKPISDVDQAAYDAYDPEIFDGAAVSIQLVGRRLEEEKMLALAKYIGEALHK